MKEIETLTDKNHKLLKTKKLFLYPTPPPPHKITKIPKTFMQISSIITSQRMEKKHLVSITTTLVSSQGRTILVDLLNNNNGSSGKQGLFFVKCGREYDVTQMTKLWKPTFFSRNQLILLPYSKAWLRACGITHWWQSSGVCHAFCFPCSAVPSVAYPFSIYSLNVNC